ncbi:YadA-like family protein [Pandoraea sp. NPDC090278]|uniref:YadA-like family protein n=1 Tax=Pandoraea sp. NPDC090278 TaxID=3364391 RepID=UPI00383BCAA8
MGTSSLEINGNAYQFAAGAPIATVSVGAPGRERTITNLAAGRIAGDSTDAVNGSQMNATTLALSKINRDLAGFETSVSTGFSSVSTGFSSVSTGMSSLSTGTLPPRPGGGGDIGNAVTYDDISKESVTLGHSLSGKPVKLNNVADGVGMSDAVNVRQLAATNGSIGALSTGMTSLAQGVTSLSTGLSKAASWVSDVEKALLYDDETHESITLGHALSMKPVKLANVADGVAPNDAATVRQLKIVGTQVTSLSTGAASLSSTASAVSKAVVALSTGLNNMAELAKDAEKAVQYDDVTQQSVTLGNRLSTKPVTVTNVADGVEPSDAVTVRQLSATNRTTESLSTSAIAFTKGITSLSTGLGKMTALTGDIESSVHYDDESQESVTLGNLLSMKPVKLTNVADGVGLSDAVTVRQMSVTNSGVGSLSTGAVATSKSVNSLSTGLKKMGSLAVDVANSVQYDDEEQESVTFGNTLSMQPVTLANIADGVALNDAVNVRQLSVTNSNVGALSTGMLTLSKGVKSLSTSMGQLTPTEPGGANGVQYDDAQQTAVTLGGHGKAEPVRLTNVADATLQGDAVNFGQLSATNAHVTSLSTSLGEHAESLSTGLGKIASLETDIASAVMYDDADRATVTLGGHGATGPVTLSNVADAKLPGDAVNYAQLGETNSNVTSLSTSVGEHAESLSTGLGKIASLETDIASAVMYDDADRATVTLGGHGATAPVTLSNVADAKLPGDAVNYAQLGATNSNVTSLSTSVDAHVDSLSTGLSQITSGGTESKDGVLYDDEQHSRVTLGGKAAQAEVKLGNVADGVKEGDAVNVRQLSLTNGNVTSLSTGVTQLTEGMDSLSTGLSTITSITGDVEGAVRYDDTSHLHVTLGGDKTKAAVRLSNVADGVKQGDAVNVRQLGVTNSNVESLSTGAVSLEQGVSSLSTGFSEFVSKEVEIENGVQYDDQKHNKVTLGGVTGKGGVKLTNVANGEIAGDAVNFGQLSATNDNVKSLSTSLNQNVGSLSTGLSEIASKEADITGAVLYDDDTHAFVTLGGKAAKSAVKLGNLADGAKPGDAVNVKQLSATNSNVEMLSTGVVTLSTGVEALSLGVGSLSTGLSSVASLAAEVEGAVMYEDVGRTRVTLGGAGSKVPVKLGNVADGQKQGDAVNVRQLGATNSGLESLSTGVVSLVEGMSSLSTGLSTVSSFTEDPEGFVRYDGKAHDTLTLGGATAKAPVKLTNVAAGEMTGDAVNFGQLSATNSHVTSLSSGLSKTDGNVEILKQGISTASVDLDALTKGLAATDNNVVALQSGLSTAHMGMESLSTGLTATDSNVVELQSGLSTAHVGMESLSTGLTATDSNVVELQAGLSTAHVGVESLSTGLMETDSNMVVLESGLREGLSEAHMGVESLSTGLTVTDSNVAALQSGLSTAHVSVESLSTGLSTTDSRLDSLTIGVGDAVQYDDATHAKITLGGVGARDPVAVGNVADGVRPYDAVNFGQLSATNSHLVKLSTGAGNAIEKLEASVSTVNSHVDSLSSGLSATAGTVDSLQIGLSTANANAESLSTGLSETSLNVESLSTGLNEANLNVGSLSTGLSEANLNVESLSTGLSSAGTSLASLSTGAEHSVQYDDETHGTLTLGGVGASAPVKLRNVAEGELSTDAVNFSQLSATNDHVTSLSTSVGEHVESLSTGLSTIASLTTDVNKFVLYDSDARDTLSLGGVSAAAPVKLRNVAEGALSTDAVNFSQLSATNEHVTSLSTSVGDHVTSLSTSVGEHVTSLSTSVGEHVESLSTGLSTIASLATDANKFVLYDNEAHDSLSLGGVSASAPVKLRNVAEGELSTDAVNFSQLSATNEHVTSLSTSVGEHVTSLSTSVGEHVESLSTGLSTIASLTTDVNKFVQYDNEAHDTLSLGGASASAPVKLRNVAEGELSTDAVNFSQLSATNEHVTSLSTSVGENVTSLSTSVGEHVESLSTGLSTIASLTADVNKFVQYDNEAHDTLSLGGASASAPVKLRNVAEGELSTDAVNFSQLSATNEHVTSLSTSVGENVTSLSTSVGEHVESLSTGLSTIASLTADVNKFVQYDNEAHDTLSLGGASASAPVKLRNVAEGELSTDAVNFSQLSATNEHVTSLSTSVGENVTSLSTSVGEHVESLSTGLSTVASLTTDVNKFVQYDNEAHDTLSLGGASASAPVKLRNVAEGALSTDAVNFSQLSATNEHVSSLSTSVGENVKSLSTGLSQVSSQAPDVAEFIRFDDNKRTRVTLGGKAATTPVSLSNVAEGTKLTDAVNIKQLSVTNSNVMMLSTGMTSLEASVVGLSTGMSETESTVDTLVSEMEVAVQYDTPNRTKLRLGGLSKTPVALSNVADGTRPTDAVNAGQLATTNSNVSSLSTGLASLITPDSTGLLRGSGAGARLTLGGSSAKAPVILGNVADGVDPSDVATFRQLSATNRNVRSLSTGLLATDGHVASLSTGVDRSVESLSTGLRNVASTTTTDPDKFVQYDNEHRDAVTLGGAAAAGPVKLSNVADGEGVTDAINLGQLNQQGHQMTTMVAGVDKRIAGLSRSLDSDVESLSTGLSQIALRPEDLDKFVRFDDEARKSITLGGHDGAAPVTLANVADGIKLTDAVNVRQLGMTNSNVMSLSTSVTSHDVSLGSLSTSFGEIDSTVEKLVSEMAVAVQYDSPTRSKLRLGGLSKTPVQLGNVADGTRPNDAVNLSQLAVTTSGVESLSTGLAGLVTPDGSLSTGLRKLAALSAGADTAMHYDDAARTMMTLGGVGSTAPVTLTNVAAGVNPADAVNFAQLSATNSNVTSLSTGLSKLASISSSDGSHALLYDDLPQGKLKLGGANAQGPILLTNLAAGVAPTDAVNVSQLATTDSRVTSLSTSASTGLSDALSAVSSLASRLGDLPSQKAKTVEPAASADADDKGTNGDKAGVPAQVAPPQTPYIGINDGGTQVGNFNGDGASGKHALAMGTETSATGEHATAVGAEAKASGAHATALGHAASASEEGSVALGYGATAYGANSVAIGANSTALDPDTVSIGSQGNERRLTNLAPGTHPTDAATVGQLWGVQSGVNQVAKRAYAGIAAATALAMIPEVDPGKRVALGVGSATYLGSAAVSIGASIRFTDNLKVKMGVGMSSQGKTYAGGVSYQW